MIGHNDPVREAFADLSTGNGGGKYYDSKEDAFSIFNTALKTYGYYMDCEDWPGRNGSIILDVWDNNNVVGSAFLSWWQMYSGRWEVIGYIT